MNYIYDYISEERKKEIADMNIVDTYQRTGNLKIPTGRVVKSKNENLLLWNNLADTLCLRQQIEETSSSDIGKDEYPNNDPAFNINTEKMKQYNTIDLSFLRNCGYKNEICKMLSKYIHSSAAWFRIIKNKIFIDDEMIVEEF